MKNRQRKKSKKKKVLAEISQTRSLKRGMTDAERDILLLLLLLYCVCARVRVPPLVLRVLIIPAYLYRVYYLYDVHNTGR